MEEILNESKIMQDNSDIDDWNEEWELYKNLVNLRGFEAIFQLKNIIEKELLLFLSDSLPEFIPFFNYIEWKSLEPYMNEINKSILIDLEKLDIITKKTQKDINSIFQNEIPKISNTSGLNKSKTNLSNQNESKSKENSLLDKTDFFDDKDLKIQGTMETAHYERYIINNKIPGTIYESDISNYIYDILYILSSGKLNMIRNQKYNYDKIDYELVIYI